MKTGLDTFLTALDVFIDDVVTMNDSASSARSEFGPRLRQLRQRRGWSLRTLGGKVNYGKTTLGRIELGAMPTLQMAEKCDEVLNAGGELVALAVAAIRGWPRPAQLPAAVPVLVGREAEFNALVSGASVKGRGPNILAVEGPPAIGKTALALSAAHAVAELYSDGTFFRDLQGYSSGSPLEPAEVLEGFLRALGVHPGSLPAQLSERSALWRSLTNDKSILVVLDNVVDYNQIEPLLPNSANATVIVTGRRRQAALAWLAQTTTIDMPPLSPESAVALLGAIIGQDRVSKEPEQAADLMKTCGFLPLAVRIAADRIARRPHHSLADLNREISRVRLLDAAAADDMSLPVRTLFSWSYRGLPAEQARAFRLLGLHPGGHISTHAAAALLGASDDTARELLEALQHMHLITESGLDRWHLHDLLRAYAHDRTMAEDSEHERAEAVRRLVAWYTYTSYSGERALAPQRATTLLVDGRPPEVRAVRFDDAASATAWFDAEQENLQPITTLALSNGLHRWAWQLPISLWSWLLLRWPTDLWTSTHTTALAAARAERDAYGEAWVLVNHAYLLRAQRQYARADVALRRSLQLREKIGDTHGQAWSLTGLGYLGVARDHPEHALSHFVRALDLFDRTEELPHGRSVVLVGMGEAHAALNDTVAARARWDDALTGFARIDDDYGRALTLAQLGTFLGGLGHCTDALNVLEESRQLRIQQGDRAGLADSLHRLGVVQRISGNEQAARQAWAEAVTLLTEFGDPLADELTRLLSEPG